eukprot:g24253.t1
MVGCHQMIRPAEVEDFKGILRLAELVAQEPDAFLFDETYTKEEFPFPTEHHPFERCGPEPSQELESQWLPEPSQHAETFILEAPGFEGIAGVYVLHPAAHGRGSHIAHGLYMVHPEARSKGYGKALCTELCSTCRMPRHPTPCLTATTRHHGVPNTSRVHPSVGWTGLLNTGVSGWLGRRVWEELQGASLRCFCLAAPAQTVVTSSRRS